MLSLPKELRREIFRHAVAPIGLVDTWTSFTDMLDATIFRVSRQCYEEANEAFFDFNTFQVSDHVQAQQLQQVTQQRRRYIKLLRIVHVIATVQHDVVHALHHNDSLEHLLTSLELFPCLQRVEFALTVSSVCPRSTSTFQPAECKRVHLAYENTLLDVIHTRCYDGARDRSTISLQEVRTTGLCARTIFINLHRHSEIQAELYEVLLQLRSSLFITQYGIRPPQDLEVC